MGILVSCGEYRRGGGGVRLLQIVTFYVMFVFLNAEILIQGNTKVFNSGHKWDISIDSNKVWIDILFESAIMALVFVPFN